jgi:hypothetical protein
LVGFFLAYRFDFPATIHICGCSSVIAELEKPLSLPPKSALHMAHQTYFREFLKLLSYLRLDVSIPRVIPTEFFFVLIYFFVREVAIRQSGINKLLPAQEVFLSGNGAS